MVRLPFIIRLQTSFLGGYGKLDFDKPHIFIYRMLVQLESLGGIVEKTYAGLMARSKAMLHAYALFREINKLIAKNL